MIVIIGYGNPLRGDDGLGWKAAELLCSMLDDEDVIILTAHQLAPELADDIKGADLVIFIDAHASDWPGRVRIQEVSPESSAPAVLSHGMRPSVLLAIAAALFNRCPRAVLFSMGGRSFGHHEGISKPVAEALPLLCCDVRAFVKGFGEHGAARGGAVHARSDIP